MIMVNGIIYPMFILFYEQPRVKPIMISEPSCILFPFISLISSIIHLTAIFYHVTLCRRGEIMVISPILLRKRIVIPLITIILVLLHGQAVALELKEYQRVSTPAAVIKYSSIGDILSPLRRVPVPVVAISRQISRGEPAQRIESRMMRVTAYTGRDKGMNGKGITANGEKALEGQTIAADSSIPFGTQIYIPELGKTFTVTDRGGGITGERLDMYMESKEDALKFGNRELEVRIKY